MNRNQDILDSLLRHKILLLGFSKQVAEQVIAYLRETEPEIRALLLKQFGVGGQRFITRLRATEARLRDIRSKAWKRAAEYVALQLLEMAEREGEWFQKTIGEPIAQPVKKDRTAAIVAAVIAGHTVSEWFYQLSVSDANRAVAQLRIGALRGETVTQLSRRLTGKLSMIATPANNAVRALTATAVSVGSDAVRTLLVARNNGLFDYELWISILDSRTTEGCRKLHMKRFPVGEGPSPGYHLHCRSDRVPLNSGGGSVLANTYGDWIVTQPRDFQVYAGQEFRYQNLRPISLEET